MKKFLCIAILGAVTACETTAPAPTSVANPVPVANLASVPNPASAPNPTPASISTSAPVATQHCPILDTGISLSESGCLGTCPEYAVTIYSNEVYQLHLGKFTRAPGTTETGVFSAGTFAAANAALQAANFTALPTNVTTGSPDCGGQTVSDLPNTSIGEKTDTGTRVVNYYPGCTAAPARPALDTLLASLRSTFRIPALVAMP